MFFLVPVLLASGCAPRPLLHRVQEDPKDAEAAQDKVYRWEGAGRWRRFPHAGNL